MNTSSRTTLQRALLLLALVVACKESSGPEEKRAATLTVQSGDDQDADVRTAVGQPLAVLVRDATGAPIEDVAVTFEVATGEGTITGGAARTGANGIATAGSWTLGSLVGEQTVEASVAGLPVVTFTATARCVPGGTLALDATLAGVLAVTDCKYAGGEFTDRITFTTTAQRAVRFSQTSQIFDTYLEIYDDEDVILAANDDSANVTAHPTSSVKVLLAPGAYELSPSSYLPAVTGGYSVAASAVPESGNVCELVFAMPGVTTVGELATGDCVSSTGFIYETIAVVMLAGRTYTITMSSTALDAYLALGPLNGAQIAFNDNAIGTNARLTFSPTVSNFYVIIVSSAAVGETGAFTLIIE